jgi:WD40 repeat protein
VKKLLINSSGCYNTPVADNPIGSALKPLLCAAAGSVVGPLGLVVAPAVATVCEWAGKNLGGDSGVAEAVAAVLSHIFGHLSGDAAKEVFSSLGEHGNHDLEIAMATAIKEALQAARKQIAPTHRILVPFEDWFQLWDDRLSGALESPEDAALLFYSSDAPDPVALAAAEEDQWWPSFRPILLRWADRPSLPPPLDEHLAKNLLDLTREAFHLVLRDGAHARGWIAWQQMFLEGIAQQTRASDAGLADKFDMLACRVGELRPYLESEFAGINLGLKRIESKLEDRRTAIHIDPYASVAPLPLNYVERPELHERLCRLILGQTHTVAVTALQGMGGIGKTEVARALCHDPKVRDAFPDGIVWLDIGRESGRTLLDRMKEVAEALNDDPSLCNAENCQKRYRTLLAKKAVLIVLDDVWSKADVEPFQPDSPRCRMLFTTRYEQIAAELGAQDFSADLLSEEQSHEVLALCSRRKPDQLPAAAAEIVRECGRLPLSLRQIGSSLRGSPDEDWRDTLETLRNVKVQTLYAPTKVSVDALEETLRQRYLRLAVLLEDMAAPAAVLRTLWNVGESEARKTMRELSERSLARREDGGIRLHNLQLAYVRSEYPDQEALGLIHRALRLSSHVVQRDATQFASQMLGRLLPYQDRVGIRGFLNAIRAAAPRPWLRPLWPALMTPGGALVRTLEGHARWVTGVAVSADGKVAVSASRDHTLKIWDLANGRELHTLRGHTGPAWGVALNADATVAVSASDDQTLKVWDMASGRELRTLQGHIGGVRGVALSADGRVAVSASYDQTLKVWDVGSGRELHTLRGHTGIVWGVAMSADGTVAASASMDHTLKVWHVASGEVLHTLQGHTDSVRGVAVSADGRLVVSASHDQTLKVWDLRSGRELHTLQGHTHYVDAVALTADGKMAVSASLDDTLKVWQVASGLELDTLRGHTGTVYGVALSADGTVAVSASGDRTLKVWEVTRGRERNTLECHNGWVNGVAVSADGKVVVSASSDKMVKVWEAASGRELHTMEGPELVSGVAMSADGRVAVSASMDGTLTVWEVASGRGLHTLRGHTGIVWGVAMSADGTVAVSASMDRTLKVWEVASGRELHTLQGHTDSVNGAAVSADGTVAASASRDRTLKIWDVASGRELRALQGHDAVVREVALSLDGRLAVSASDDKTLKIWEVASGRELGAIQGHTAAVRAVALRANGKVAVSASGDRLKVWELAGGDCLATFTCDAPVLCCALAGDLVVAGDEAGRVHLLVLELRT